MSKATTTETKKRHTRRVGLFGGSFNPAHEGHLYISEQALDLLALDEVWWLVSPQNPLKAETDMAPFAERMALAEQVAVTDPRIRVSDFEVQAGTRYTIDTITALKARHPDIDFVWMLGADNLRQMPKWKGWRRIFHSLPIAVFPRAPYSLRALRGRAARRFARAEVPQAHAERLAAMRPPSWVMLRVPLHGQSATRLRRIAATQKTNEKANKEAV